MKSLLYFLTLSLCSFTSAYAIDAQSVPAQESQDEVAKIELLIEATQASLTRLENLKVMLVEYKQVEAKAVKDTNDTDNLLRLVNLASDIQDTITAAGLHDYFSPQFIEELKKFAQISQKKNIPQAK